MILNLQQQQAVDNGEPVPMNVAGTECVLLRRDVYLRTNRELETEPRTAVPKHSVNATSEKAVSPEPTADFDPEPPPWLDVENDVYFPMTVPEILLEIKSLIVERGTPSIILPEELPDE